MTDTPCLITSALPYVNNILHLGNIIGSVLSADVHTRYLRKMQKQVLFVCGTDEYGTTTEIKALQEGLTCQGICDKYHELQKESLRWFNISCDVFGRTTTDTQTKLAQKIFLELWENGHLEGQTMNQLWCTKCNMFIADRYVKGICINTECNGITKGDQCDKCGLLVDVNKLISRWCSICGTEPEIKSSKHLFLRLDDFKAQIEKYFFGETSKVKYMSNTATAITKHWLSKKLESRCITRDLKWGTPVPKIEGLEDYWNKVFYVWFDAPIGYLSIIEHDGYDLDHWLKGNWYQFMAKDNVPFHSIIFPATLMGSKIEGMVTHLSATEYLDFEGKKFSKSENVGIFCDQVKEISERLHIDEDYWRYYLIKKRPETADTSFAMSEFAEVIRGELAQKIGNLVNRVISLKKKYYTHNDIKYDFTHFKDLQSELLLTVDKILEKYESFQYRDAVKFINRLAEIGNEYVNHYTLWNILKDTDKLEENQHYLGNVAIICWLYFEYCEPIMPNKTVKVRKYFQMPQINFESVKSCIELGKDVINIVTDEYEILFNQIKLGDV